jgi:hypothetical protein
LILRKLKETFGSEWFRTIPAEIAEYWKALECKKGSFYPTFRDYKIILGMNWEIFGPIFKGLDRKEMFKTLQELKRKRDLAYHASPRVSEKDVEETITSVKKLMIDSDTKEEFEKVLRGERLTSTEVRIIGPIIFELNGVSSAEELAKLTDLPIHTVKMILRHSLVKMGLLGVSTSAEMSSAAALGAPVLRRERLKTEKELYFITAPVDELLRKYPELGQKEI